MSSPTIHRLQVLGAGLLFSTGGAAIKATELSGWQVASVRSGIAAVTLWLLMPAWRRWWQPRSLLVGLAYAATMILFVVGNKLTTAASMIFLQSTAPMYLLLLGPWLLGERLRKSEIIYVVLIVVGLAFFFVGNEPPVRTAPDPSTGNILSALSGFTWALTILGLRWLSRNRNTGMSAGNMSAGNMSAGNMSAGNMSADATFGDAVRGQASTADTGGAVIAGNVIACLVCAPLAFPIVGAGTTDWIVIGYLGVFQIGLAYILMTHGVRGVSALETSLLLLLEPVLNSLWAFLVHGEKPGPWSLAGCAIIFSVTVVRTLRRE